jgi:hypothetical protein
MRTKSTFIIAFSLIFISVLLLTTSVSTKAEPVEAVIDFEGIPPGTIVDTLYSGYGISGAPIEGHVIVFGFNPVFGEGINTAMIFDATCPPPGGPPPPGDAAFCSGNDADLFNPSFGNTIIISEDLDSSDPDDADEQGERLGFEYTQLGDGDGAFIESLEVMDIEEDQGELEDAKIIFYEGGLDGTPVGEVDIPHTGNGNTAIVPVNIAGVEAMKVDLAGSGTINNIRFLSEPTAVELLYLRVERPTGGEVILSWATAAEIDNLGFFIYRGSTLKLGDAERIHFEPAGGGSAGHTYSFTDSPGEGSWFYWLSDIDTHGVETFHLPSTQRAKFSQTIFLPFLVGK